MAIKTYGTMAVDWERRIDFDRLRRERLGAHQGAAGEVGAGRGALLRHEQRPLHHGHAHRHVGAGQDQPLHAAAAERRADPLGLRLRRAAPPAELRLARRALARRHPADARRDDARRWAAPRTSRARSSVELEKRGLHKEPVGVDVVEPPVLFALQKEGLNIVDGQQLMSDAREIKTRGRDLAAHAFGGDGGRRLLRPLQGDEAGHARERRRRARGARRSTRWARSTSRASTPSRRERCSPHPHVFSDRMMRPGDPVFYDILHSYMGYRTCYYRCFAIGSASHAAGGCLQALPRLPRRVDRADSSRPLDRGSRVGVAEGARSSASRTRKRRSRCRWATASAWRSGRSR